METELLLRADHRLIKFGFVEEWMNDKNGKELTIVSRKRSLSAP